MGNNPNINIKEIVRESCKEKGLSLARLALQLSTNQVYLLNVLHGRKVSRPMISKIAKALNIPNLPTLYELFLKDRKNKSKKPRGKGKIPLGGGESNADARRQEE